MTKPSVGVFLAFFFIVPLVIATAAGSDAVDATNCPTCGDKPFDYNSTPGAVDSAPAAAVPRSIGGDVTQVTKTEDGITFRADTGPDLDLWQPCDGGDRRITFTIDASELAPALERTEIKRATLKLRAWDVDPLGNPVVPECLHEVDHVYFNNRLLAQVLTGADGQWSTPTFEIDPDWVNEGGNTVLVTIDDLGTTCWCLKVDWGELYVELAPLSYLESIEIKPAIPVTDGKITFDAQIKDAPGYEITGIQWALTDLKNGHEITKSGPSTVMENPWVFTPSMRDYGNRRVTCRVFATYTKTGKQNILVGEKTLDFKVFFKYYSSSGSKVPADDDGNSIPNWYQHWKDDGAVPGLTAPNVNFKAGEGYGATSPSGMITITNLASGTHYPRPIPVSVKGNTESFGGPQVTGIDCAAEVVAHEQQHVWQFQTSNAGNDHDKWPWQTAPRFDALGQFWRYYYNNDPCPDGLYDAYELSIGTDPGLPDTYNVAGAKGYYDYHFYGDGELDAMRAATKARGVPDKDWADTGKQAAAYTGPVERTVKSAAFPADSAIVQLEEESGELNASIASAPTAAGVDLNGNGLFDIYRVKVPVHANRTGMVSLIARLHSGGGTLNSTATNASTVSTSSTLVDLDFDGTEVARSGVSGAAQIEVSLYDIEGEGLFDSASVEIPLLSASQFEGSQIALTGAYSDTATDTNADGVDDYLDVSAGLTVTHPGTYTILAGLYAGTEQIATTSNAVGPGTGAQTVTLRFDGATIATNQQNGPYRLRSVAIVDDRGLSLDYADDPYGTAAYQWTQFLPNSLSFRAPFTDRGLDANGDGLFDQLAVDVVTDVTAAGEYTFTSVLVHNETGGVITQGSNVVVLGTGAQTVPLAFDGGEIFSRGQNGPYRLASLTVYDEAGRIAATANNLHTTGTYTFSDFRHSDITLGDYADRGVDTNSNGYYDSLVVQFNVTVPTAGEYAINARLLAPNGAEVQWVGLTESLAAETPAMITMTFDGRLIHGAGQSGTFSLGDLSIYRNDSTGAPLYVTTAFSTNAYEYSQFESTTTIRGTIVSAFNAWPVKNANVYVTGVASATTDAAGRYILNVLTPGTYAVRVEPPARYGLSSTSESVTVDSSGAATHDFILFSTGLPAPTINAIVPNMNVQGGVVPVTVTGAGFVNDPTLFLSRIGSADIEGSISSVTATSIEGTFNLIGAVEGAWDVIVTNPDGQRAIKAGGFTVNGGTTPDPARFRFAPPSLKVPKGGTNTTTLYLDTLTTGLAGFNITLALSLPDPAIGEIVDVTLPGWAIHSNSSLPADSVWIRAADLANITGPGGDALIGTVTIRGDRVGQTELRIAQVWIDDERGRNVPAQLAVCTVNVMPSVLSVPGGTGLPTDPDTDRLYEDVNGNGRKDFADVVLYFNQMSWIATNEPVEAFDYNGNGRIDFADVVWLFNHL